MKTSFSAQSIKLIKESRGNTMEDTLKRGLKFRCYPNERAKHILDETFGSCRLIYNKYIDLMKYSHDNGNQYTTSDAFKAVTTKLKYVEGYEFLQKISSVPLQQAGRHAKRAFEDFFKSFSSDSKIKCGYPKCSSKRGRQSAHYVGNAFKIRHDKNSRWGFLKLAKIDEEIKFRVSKDIDWDSVSSLAIFRNTSGVYELSVVYDFKPEILPEVQQACGVDLGLNVLAAVVTNNGDRYTKENPRYFRRTERKLSREQHELSRMKRGSKNYYKKQKRIAKLHDKIFHQRENYLHTFSRRLINDNQVIGLEDLSVSSMVKNHKLSKSIHDASWSKLVRFIKYKAQDAGRLVFLAERFYASTQICSVCGENGGKKPLNIRDWICSNCGSHLDRDFNAATNLMLQSMDKASFEAGGSTDSINACGENVRLQLSEATFCEAGTHRSR